MGTYTLRAASSNMDYGTSYVANVFTWSGVTDPGESWTFGITWRSGNYSGTIQSRSSADRVTWNPTADNGINQLMADKLTAAIYVTGIAYNNGSPAATTNLNITLRDLGNRTVTMTVGNLTWTLDGTTDPIGISTNQMLGGYGYGQVTVTFAKDYSWDLGTYTYPNYVLLVDKYSGVQIGSLSRIVGTDNFRGTMSKVTVDTTCIYKSYSYRQLENSQTRNVESFNNTEVEVLYYEPPSVDSYSADRDDTTITCSMSYSIFSIGSNAVQGTEIELNGTIVSGTSATFTLALNLSRPCYFRVRDKITTTEVIKLVPTQQMPISIFDDTLGNSAVSFGEMCLDYNTKDSVYYPNIINLIKDTQFRLTPPTAGASQIYVPAYDALNYKVLFENRYNHPTSSFLSLWEWPYEDLTISGTNLSSSTLRVYYQYHEKLNMLELVLAGNTEYNIDLNLTRSTGDSSKTFSSYMNTIPNVSFNTDVFYYNGTKIGNYAGGILGGSTAFDMNGHSSNRFNNIILGQFTVSYWIYSTTGPQHTAGDIEIDIVGKWSTSDSTKTSHTLKFPPVYGQIWLGW